MKNILLAGFFIILASVSVYAEITVVSTKGEAAFLDGRTWKTLTAGQTLKEGATVSTGVKSSAILNIDGHRLTLKPLTTIKIFKNSLSENSSDNNIALKHGRVNARVNRIGRLKTNFNIATPVATSSVRGTEQNVSYGPISGMKVSVVEGVVSTHNKHGIKRTLQGRSVFIQAANSLRNISLLGDVKREAVVTALVEGITSDEQAGLEVFGDQLIDGKENPIDLIIPGMEKTDIRVDVTWPTPN